MNATAKSPGLRTYDRRECITFRKTNERFGGLSNMAAGYLLNVNGVRILTSEALYQACRFPHKPDVQRQIIAERSPMSAKMLTKPYRHDSRPDWDIVRTKIMRWSLQVKLIQNWDTFSTLLLATEDLAIVEDSRKDNFWGAKPVDDYMLVGSNVLGRLLMQVREQIKTGELTYKTNILPLAIKDFLLYEREIEVIPSTQKQECQFREKSPAEFLDLNFLTKIQEHPPETKEETENDTPKVSQATNKVGEKIPLPEVVSVTFIDSSPALKAENVSSKRNSLKELVPQNDLYLEDYDAAKIMLPYLVKSLLNVERTVKELKEMFKNTSEPVMKEWLKYAVEAGEVKRLSRPRRYTAAYDCPNDIFLSANVQQDFR